MAHNFFTYATWTPNTQFKLVNVDWDSTYRDIVAFGTSQEREKYFRELRGVEFTDAVMHKYGEPVRLPLPYPQVQEYNYLIAFNDYPDYRQYYYYFIEDTKYVSATQTVISLELDVWTTYQFNIKFGQSFVERGHVGIANRSCYEMKDNGKGYLDLPEGLDCGSDYSVTSDSVYSIFYNGRTNQWSNPAAIIVSSIDLSRNPGPTNAPRVFAAKGSNADDMPNGCQISYMPDARDLTKFMAALNNYPIVANGIQMIYAVPPLPLGILNRCYEYPLIGGMGGTNVRLTELSGRISPQWDMNKDISDWKGKFRLPERYKNLKKLLTYPYASIEITNNEGDAITLKPQLLQSDKGFTLVIAGQWIAPNPMVKAWVEAYNRTSGRSQHRFRKNAQDNELELSGEFMDASITLATLPTFTIVNDNGQLYLQTHAHQIAYQREAAGWAYRKTEAGINNSLQQAAFARERTTAQTANDVNTRNTVTGIQNMHTGIGAGIGVVGSLASGNPLGALAGAANGVNTVLANNATASAQNASSAQSRDIENRYNLQSSQANARYAQYAAKGDYQNAIAAINAQVQDSQVVPPSVVGNSGGNTFNYSHNLTGFHIKYRQISRTAMKTVGEYFLRYGYYVQRFLTPRLTCMTNFEYWKMAECYLKGTHMTNEQRMTIRGIFEKGVTVWHDPKLIGVCDLGNNEPVVESYYE